MSYYGEKSENQILKEVVISELNEFSGNSEVTARGLKGFIIRKVFIYLLVLTGSALFCALCEALLLFLVVFGFWLYTVVTFCMDNKLVLYIMYSAKKMPDKRISTIISELCECGERGERGESTTNNGLLIEKKITAKRSKKPLIIICSALAIIAAGISVYLFVPITLYEDTENGYAISYCRTGLTGSVSIEPYTSGKKVVGIKSGAFKNNFFLNNIELPDSIKFIEGEAFMNCTMLKEIEIPPKVTVLRGDTFNGCKMLRKVIMNDDITEIHAACFKNCAGLQRISLPDKITEIRANTFEGCKSLIAIDVPEGVNRIAARAFYDCDSLSVVSLPDSLAEIGSSAFRNCGKLYNITIPHGCSVNERAFKDSPTTIEYQ